MSLFAPPLVVSREGLFCLDRDTLRDDSGTSSFLYESRGEEGADARYSYEAFDPWLEFRASGSDIEVRREGTVSGNEGNPFSLLQQLIEPFEQERAGKLPPFPDVVGYIGYGASSWTLPVTGLKLDPLALPDMAVAFYDTFLIRDRLEKRTWLVSTGLPARGADGIARARRRIGRLRERTVPFVHRDESQTGAGRPSWAPAMEGGYRRSIESVLDQIRNGQIYQANITRLFRFRREGGDPFGLYEALTRSNPSAYAGILHFRDFSVLSSSPELFLRMDGDLVESSPIKGTRPRSDDPAEDRRLAAELLRSEKRPCGTHHDRRTLVRNDLGMNCRYGSIYVDPMYEVRSYSSVHHLSSTVCGTLDEGRGFIDVMRGLFPGGSITGAPKRRSVEIINDEEGEGRGPFYGTMGFYSFDRKAAWNLLIRSAVVKGDEVAFRVGGGIVADSEADREWRELAWKGSRLYETFSTRSSPSLEEVRR